MNKVYCVLGLMLFSLSAEAREPGFICVDSNGTRYDMYIDNGDTYVTGPSSNEPSRLDLSFMDHLTRSLGNDEYAYEFHLNGQLYALVKFKRLVDQGTATIVSENKQMGCIRPPKQNNSY